MLHFNSRYDFTCFLIYCIKCHKQIISDNSYFLYIFIVSSYLYIIQGIRILLRLCVLNILIGYYMSYIATICRNFDVFLYCVSNKSIHNPIHPIVSLFPPFRSKFPFVQFKKSYFCCRNNIFIYIFINLLNRSEIR